MQIISQWASFLWKVFDCDKENERRIVERRRRLFSKQLKHHGNISLFLETANLEDAITTFKRPNLWRALRSALQFDDVVLASRSQFQHCMRVWWLPTGTCCEETMGVLSFGGISPTHMLIIVVMHLKWSSRQMTFTNSYRALAEVSSQWNISSGNWSLLISAFNRERGGWESREVVIHEPCVIWQMWTLFLSASKPLSIFSISSSYILSYVYLLLKERGWPAFGFFLGKTFDRKLRFLRTSITRLFWWSIWYINECNECVMNTVEYSMWHAWYCYENAYKGKSWHRHWSLATEAERFARTMCSNYGTEILLCEWVRFRFDCDGSCSISSEMSSAYVKM